MMKIGLKSLHKFENRSNLHSSRRSRAINSPNLDGTTFLNALGALSISNGIDPQEASILLEMIKADRYGLLTNDISQLKKDLQEYYLQEKLARGCVSKQMNLQVRYPINMSPNK
jgi:hypothetical protein